MQTIHAAYMPDAVVSHIMHLEASTISVGVDVARCARHDCRCIQRLDGIDVGQPAPLGQQVGAVLRSATVLGIDMAVLKRRSS